MINNIIKRDIEQRFKVMHTTSFEQMSHHLLNVSPSIIVEKNLKEMLSLKSPPTAKNYLSYRKQAYLLSGILKNSPKSRLRVVGEKVYPIDVALMNNRENAFAGVNLGWRLETIVYLYLISKYKGEGKDIYYLAERSGECDFIVCDNRRAILAIQVSYDISNPKTKKREISGLVLAAKKTGCTDLLLLTDYEYEDTMQDSYKIEVRPTYEYLTQS